MSIPAHGLSTSRLWVVLFLPFAAGYFLSYLYRSVNAVIGPDIAGDLALSDAQLGLLTSTYFLAFGAAQLPLGMALDRFGPRRVQTALLSVAAVGAAVFAMAPSLSTLAFGRALIGLGVAACLMGSFKAFALWFPPDRQASLTGAVMSAGGLGALAAAGPLDWSLGFLSWRELFWGLCLLTLCVAGLIFVVVPEKKSAQTQTAMGFGELVSGLMQVYRHPHFWAYAPLGLACVGGFMALQGLWAVGWMMDVEGLSRAQAAHRLTLMSLAMLTGFLILAFGAGPLARKGYPPKRLFQWALGASILALAWLVLMPQKGGAFAWMIMAIGFSFSNLGYGLVAERFGLALSGRANTAYNLFVFVGAFGFQWGLGGAIMGVQAFGFEPALAYRGVFAGLCIVQILAYIAFLRATRGTQQEGKED
jgi:MFS family permease